MSKSDNLGEATGAPEVRGKVPEKFKVFVVDGGAIRNRIDDDFCLGANGARYGYCPIDEIWLEQTTPSDMAATLLHEMHECVDMMENGTHYEAAHAAANVVEKKLRAAIVDGTVKIATLAEAVKVATEWAKKSHNEPQAVEGETA